MNEKTYVALARTAEIPPGTQKSIEANGRSLLLCHSNNRIYAIANRCSHADEKLECGRMKANFIVCPVHGSRFDLETGKAMNAPATLPIETFPVRIAGDMIEIAL